MNNTIKELERYINNKNKINSRIIDSPLGIGYYDIFIHDERVTFRYDYSKNVIGNYEIVKIALMKKLFE